MGPGRRDFPGGSTGRSAETVRPFPPGRTNDSRSAAGDEGTMNVFIARQPIFDANQRVYGYELLYRSGDRNFYTGAEDGDSASLSVLRNALVVLGAGRISGGRKAFVNFTGNLLLAGAAFFLPKEIGVVEILEDVEPVPELLEAIRSLRAQGYRLALDDFVLRGNENNPLVDLVDIIKVDFRQTDTRQKADIAEWISRKRGGIRFLAEKMETGEEFEQALQMGCSLFQGYFFCKPVVIAGRDIPSSKANCLGILKELSAEFPDFNSIRKHIERDPSLTFKLFKYINSAFFGLRCEVASIRQALDLLGENELRKWASIAAVAELGKGRPAEVLKLSLLRACMCEKLAAEVGFQRARSEFFLVGLLSCLDALLGRPMGEILGDIPLAQAPRAALLGLPNIYRKVFDLVLSYESADWELFSELASGLGTNPWKVPQSYSECVQWADGAFR